MKAHFEMMAAYNAWANARVAAAVAPLSDADLRQDLGAFFGSIHGTMNHLILADLIWLSRFRDEPAPSYGLDTVLHEDRGALAEARSALDAEIIAHVAGLTEADLAAEMTYTPVTIPEPVTQARGPALAHAFNHQTHHRGQIHAMLTRVAGAAPPLDLLYFQREAT